MKVVTQCYIYWSPAVYQAYCCKCKTLVKYNLQLWLKAQKSHLYLDFASPIKRQSSMVPGDMSTKWTYTFAMTI